MRRTQPTLFEIETDEQRRRTLGQLRASFRRGNWKVRREVLAQLTERFPELTQDLLRRTRRIIQ